MLTVQLSLPFVCDAVLYKYRQKQTRTQHTHQQSKIKHFLNQFCFVVFFFFCYLLPVIHRLCRKNLMNHDRNSDLFDMNNLYLHFGLYPQYNRTYYFWTVYRLYGRKNRRAFFLFISVFFYFCFGLLGQVLKKCAHNTQIQTHAQPNRGYVMWPCCALLLLLLLLLTALLKYKIFLNSPHQTCSVQVRKFMYQKEKKKRKGFPYGNKILPRLLRCP